jgi:asparagine synthase (glutamine-hydrolysing)
MCGIAGVYFPDGRPVERSVLRAMGDVIAHRGPDGEGFHVEEQAQSIGLVSRRLAVIDVPGGAQPMTVEWATLVYNGEVFNARELRAELESAGHRFRTSCDTEVVLRGYVEWGTDVLHRMNGMWALAIWDSKLRRLFLARDRLGVKPLVYANTPAGFAFGSEIKAVVASGLVGRELDPAALPHYLSSFAVPEPLTLVRGVRRLPAGHSLIVDPSGVREERWWDCAVPEEDDRGAEAYAEEVQELLEDAVGRRLVADVPLGVLLSGGIDSRLMATFASRAGQSPLRSFTLGFDMPGADERAPARAVAEALGTVHREEVVGAREAVAALPDLLAAYDEPGESLVQNHFISRLARHDVTVGLSGLGGDELFAAYPTHVVVNLLSRYDRLPAVLRVVLRQTARFAPSRRLRRAAALATMDPDARVAGELMHQIPAALRSDLLAPEIRAAVDLDGPVRHLEEHFDRARAHHPLNRLLYVYIKTYLTDELLRATDAMSMHHSLEVRTPFLDYRLVELAMRIPAHHKMRLRTGKRLLHDIAGRTLEVAADPIKHGFAPPVAGWLQAVLGERVRDALAEDVVRRRGVFDPVAARKVLEGSLAGDPRMVPPAMMLYSFETWAQRWLDTPAPAHGSLPTEVRTAQVGTVAPSLSVIIVNWNTREILRECLASIAEHLGGVEHEVIVVDNASTDGSAEMVATDFPAVRLVRNAENVGFGAANNQAMRLARGARFLLLNSDTRLVDGSVSRLVSELDRHPGVGVAQGRQRFPDGRLQHTTYRFPSLRLALLEDLGVYKLLGRRRAGQVLLNGYWPHDVERDVDWVAGSFMLLPRAVFEDTGGFDERLFMYGEDQEWCQRIRDAGWRIRFFPQAEIVHRDHASADIRFGSERVALCLQRGQDLFRERHGRARSALFIRIRVVGAGMRAAWYSLRARLGGRRGKDYVAMQPSVMMTFRMLRSIAARRR